MRFLLFLFLSSFVFSCTFDLETGRERRRDIDHKQRKRNRKHRKSVEEKNTVQDIAISEDDVLTDTENSLTLEESNDVNVANPPEEEIVTHFVLPIRLMDSNTNILLHSNKERTTVGIKSDPDNKIFQITASLDGIITLADQSLSIRAGSTNLLLELDLENTKLSVKSGDKVKAKQILGETKKPIYVSLQRGDKFVPLCLTVTDNTNSGVTITHTKDVSEQDPCVK